MSQRYIYIHTYIYIYKNVENLEKVLRKRAAIAYFHDFPVPFSEILYIYFLHIKGGQPRDTEVDGGKAGGRHLDVLSRDCFASDSGAVTAVRQKKKYNSRSKSQEK